MPSQSRSYSACQNWRTISLLASAVTALLAAVVGWSGLSSRGGVTQTNGHPPHAARHPYGPGLLVDAAGTGGGDVVDERGQFEQHRSGGGGASERQCHRTVARRDGGSKPVAVRGGEVAHRHGPSSGNPAVRDTPAHHQVAVGFLSQKRVQQDLVGIRHAPGVRGGPLT